MNEHSDVQAMKAYIDLHFTEPDLTVMKLEGMFADVYANISRRFKVQLGETPGRYITNKRITHALDLMQKSTMSLEEISFTCGYTDVRGIHGAFRRKFGKPPRSCADQMAANAP